MRFTKTSFALTLAAAFAAFSSAATIAGETVGFAFADHPIYAFKDNKSEVVATVRANDVIVISGSNCAIYFCQVWHPYTNKMGFMNAPFKTRPDEVSVPTKSTEGYATVTRQLDLRAAPTAYTKVLGQIYEGGRVKKERCEGNYCYVTTGRGYQGWALKAGLEDDKGLKLNENIVRPLGTEIQAPAIIRPVPRP